MQNDTTEPDQPAAALLDGINILGDGKTCVYCGDPTTEIVCPECEAKNAVMAEAAALAEANAAREIRRKAFREKVGSYADTEIDRLPDTAAKRAAAEYVIGGKAGLTISGPGDTGKTRSVVWVASKELEAGAWVEFRQCGDLRQEVIQHAKNGEYGRGVKPLMNCDILILDDFGNHEFTRTSEEFFLSLFERRTNGGKRTFLTTQYSSPQLRPLFTTLQMADAILRRFGRSFSTMVDTRENTVLRWK